jgi:pre-mRNA-splicing factor ATP-dependent RNA helicase DHX15/PRP43
MESLARNKVAATQIQSLEDGIHNPLTKKPFSGTHEVLVATRRKLPVSGRMPELLSTYQNANIMVLSSDTGSGKSTQVPQLVLYDEWASGLSVVCTQLRVLAAKGVAERVAHELDVKLGEEVGYHIRFDAMRGDKTRLVYMTEGILIREATSDRNLSRNACVIIDEAHERTINTDILVALLKGVVSRRTDFKVSTTSIQFPSAAHSQILVLALCIFVVICILSSIYLIIDVISLLFLFLFSFMLIVILQGYYHVCDLRRRQV